MTSDVKKTFPILERHSAFHNDEEFIENCYMALLRRHADSGAMDHYKGKLIEGSPRSDVIRNLRNSREFSNVNRGWMPGQVFMQLISGHASSIWTSLLSANIKNSADIENIARIVEAVVDRSDTSLDLEEMHSLFGPILGWVDPVRNGKITGWLVHQDMEEVDIFIEGASAGAAKCDHYRPDLESAGFDDPCCGFYYEIEPGRIQAAASTIQVFVDGEPLLPSDRISSDWLIARRDGLRAIANFGPFQSRAFKGR